MHDEQTLKQGGFFFIEDAFFYGATNAYSELRDPPFSIASPCSDDQYPEASMQDVQAYQAHADRVVVAKMQADSETATLAELEQIEARMAAFQGFPVHPMSQVRFWVLSNLRIAKPPHSLPQAPLSSLTVRIGVPYVFVHQGCCEHHFIFKEVRTRHSSDIDDRSAGG